MKVAVIGAGAAGLATCRELLKEGHEPQVFEQQTAVGGVWVYDDREVSDPLGQGHFSSLYASLRTNLPHDLMAFNDYAFDDTGATALPRFPHHSAVLTYLERFADDFNLHPWIRCGKKVTRIQPQSEDAWLVTLADGSAETFAAVAICNGHYSVPNIPSLPGIEQFHGECWHSHNYRHPDPFTDKRVALWGAAASAADISREIAGVAERVDLMGNRYAASAGVQLDHMRLHGSPLRVSGPNTLTTASGQIKDIDVLIYCTGYQYRFDFLDEDIVTVNNNRVEPLYRDLVHPNWQRLGFIGINYLVVPFPLFALQARWFARLLSGRFQLPAATELASAIAQRVAAFNASGQPDRHFHRLGDDQIAYMAELANECGSEPPPAWFHELTKASQAARLADPAGFRDQPLPEIGTRQS